MSEMQKDPPDAEPIADAIRRAEAALASLRRSLNEGKYDEAAAKAAQAASTLLREGEEMIAKSEALNEAKSELRGAVRRSPLTSLGIAFGAGLLFAILTRG